MAFAAVSVDVARERDVLVARRASWVAYDAAEWAHQSRQIPGRGPLKLRPQLTKCPVSWGRDDMTDGPSVVTGST